MGVGSKGRSKNPKLTIVGILALYCCMSEFAILTPSIAAFSHHFVDTDVTTIMLANSVTGIVPCLFADSTLVYALGVFLLGFGGSAFFTAAQNATGNIAPRTRVAFVSGIMTSMMNLGPFIMTSMMNLGPFIGPYVFSASMLAMPALGTDAIFPVLIVVAAVCAVVGLAHPMKALAMRPASVGE